MLFYIYFQECSVERQDEFGDVILMSTCKQRNVSNYTHSCHFSINPLYSGNLQPGPEVIKLEFILKLKIKRTDWLLADMCPQVANHCALF